MGLPLVVAAEFLLKNGPKIIEVVKQIYILVKKAGAIQEPPGKFEVDISKSAEELGSTLTGPGFQGRIEEGLIAGSQAELQDKIDRIERFVTEWVMRWNDLELVATRSIAGLSVPIQMAITEAKNFAESVRRGFYDGFPGKPETAFKVDVSMMEIEYDQSLWANAPADEANEDAAIEVFREQSAYSIAKPIHLVDQDAGPNARIIPITGDVPVAAAVPAGALVAPVSISAGGGQAYPMTAGGVLQPPGSSPGYGAYGAYAPPGEGGGADPKISVSDLRKVERVRKSLSLDSQDMSEFVEALRAVEQMPKATLEVAEDIMFEGNPTS